MVKKELNLKSLRIMIKNGLISRRKHPYKDLYILNYTPKVQYDYIWNKETIMCRGLIVDSDYNIVERPFEKFFNYNEKHAFFPDESFEVWEKMDGSLGILYFIDDLPHIATRGSFESEQAITATKMLREGRYSEVDFSIFDRSKTYLFEIIYPDNQIVVNYAGETKLVLLGIIDTITGEESSIKEAEDIAALFEAPNYFGSDISPEELLTLDSKNKEGFVLRFASGHRLKIKFEEYKKLHSIVACMTPRKIWSAMKDSEDLGEINSIVLAELPDELYMEIKQIQSRLLDRYASLEASVLAEYNRCNLDCSRKEIAMQFSKSSNAKILFNILDKKEYSHIIWGMIRP
jgi:RNA ligase